MKADTAAAIVRSRESAARRDLYWSAYLAVVRVAPLAMVLLLAAGVLGRAVAKPLWHDELFTYYLANNTTPSGLWHALATAADLNPPLYHWSVQLLSNVFGPGPLATRLPAALGFVTATYALYVFVRRRLDRQWALVAAMTPSLTGVYLYAFEGRPYGLVLGCSAVALAAWQRRGEPGSHRLTPAVCALMLAASTSSHYYGVLMVLPLVAGELARAHRTRRFDWPMLLAFMLSVAPLLALRPLIAAARGFAPTFWAPPSVGELGGYYRQLLEPLALVLFAAAVVWTGIVVLTRLLTRRTSAMEPETPVTNGLLLEELVAASALLALPVAGYLLAVAVTGAFHERYVLQGVLGFSILLAWWSPHAARTRTAAATLLVVVFLAFAGRQAAGAVGLIRGASNPLVDHQPVLALAPVETPLVVSHALPFLQLAHYQRLASGRALTYLTRPPDVVKQMGGDTGARALRILAGYAPLEVEEYEPFVRSHQQFYVYGPRSWLVPKLLTDGADVRLVRENGDASLHAVTTRR